MKHALISFFLTSCFLSFSQDTRTINTDRPTQSASTIVMPKRQFQFEYGFIHERVNADISNTTFLNGLFRYGLFTGLELRLTQDVAGVTAKNTGSETTTDTGLNPLILGTKVHVWNENGARPQFSFIAQTSIPYRGSIESNSLVAQNELRLNFSNTLGNDFSLGYNTGINFSKSDHVFFYSVVLYKTFQRKWTTFIEPYAFIDQVFDQRFDFGVIYLAKSRLQFDVTGGVGIANAPDWFLGFGAAYLF